MAHYPAYQEIVNLIAGLAPERLVNFRVSADTVARVQDLLTKKNAGELSPSEQIELDYFVFLEKMIGLNILNFLKALFCRNLLSVKSRLGFSSLILLNRSKCDNSLQKLVFTLAERLFKRENSPSPPARQTS